MNTTKYLKYYLTLNQNKYFDIELPSLETLEVEYINYVFELTGSDLIRTAEILNISPGTLFKKQEKFDIYL